MPLEPGTRLGPFEIVAALGAGGMGEVYRACDARLGREVALKTLRRELVEEGRDRFWREARAAAAVSHPNVCPIYDVGEVDGQPWLAMELMVGESLEARLERGPLPVEEAITRTREVLAALDALHARGIVHRDLKPSNVFLTAHGAKLLDFGLALPRGGPFGAEVALTRPGTLIGTPRYMAPEQWRGEPANAATDLFAVGAILYEMLTGTPAFRGETPVEIYEAVIRDQPPALAGGAGVEALDRVVHRALAKRAADRFGSAREAAEALERAVARDGSGAPPVVARPVTRLVVAPFPQLRPDPETAFLGEALADAISSSLAGVSSLVVRSPRVVGELDGADLGELARRAQVDAVVTGKLLRVGDRVRLHAQLVDAPSGTVRGATTADASLGDLFAVVDELTRAIVDELRLPLTAPERGRLGRDAPADGAAYELYLRATSLPTSTARASSLFAARDLYQQVLERDPSFAPAWARLGRIQRLLGKYGHDDAAAAGRRAREAFERAFALSPELPLAHRLYTHFEVEDLGRPASAMLRLVERMKQGTSDPELYGGLVVACRYCGLFEASLAADERARSLDPNVRTSVHYTYWMMGDYQRAHDHDDEPVAFVKNYALEALGREKEALAAYRRWLADDYEGVERDIAVATIALFTRDYAGARAAARRVLESGFTDCEGLYFDARILVRAEALEDGLDLLGRVVRGGFTVPETMQRDPWLEPLRDEPRFRALIEEARAARNHAGDLLMRSGGGRLLGLDDATLMLDERAK